MKLKHFGLVLGGGIARGYIHIGIRKYLEEKALYPEEIVGTSAGGIIGALIAMGKTREEIRDIALMFNTKKRSLIDVSLTNGLIKGEKLLSFFRKILDDQQIENTKIPLKLTTVDIQNARIKIFDSGPMAEALRATMSMPMVFAPITIQGTLYVDGGLMSNLPIEYCSKKRILAVSIINQKYDVKVNVKKKFSISKGILGADYSILHKTLELLVKQNELKSLQTKNKKVILINKEHNFGGLDFQRCDEMIDFGYQAMQELFGV